MQKDEPTNEAGAVVPSTALLDRSGIQLSSDDWWSFDTAKHGFFFEKCCGCGLVHKTHIRIEGTRIHFRHERLDGDPPLEMVDQSSVIVSNPGVLGTGHLVDRTEQPVVGGLNSEGTE